MTEKRNERTKRLKTESNGKKIRKKERIVRSKRRKGLGERNHKKKR